MNNCKAKQPCSHLPKSHGEWLIYCEQCKYDFMTSRDVPYKDNLTPLEVAELIQQARREENDKFAVLLNPRLWTKKEHDAWHQNIPDLQAAFDALVATQSERG